MARQKTSEFDQTVEMDQVQVITPDEVIEETTVTINFDDNLAEKINEEQLESLSSELVDQYESDKRSRSEYEATMKKGIDLLGLKLEDTNRPFIPI